MVEAALLSASTNDRCGLRVERLPSPSPLSLTPTPLLRHGVGPLPLRLGQQTLLASPFPLPHRHLRFTSVSMRSNSNAPRNLRLLFRSVDAGMPHSLPPFRTIAILTDTIFPSHRGRSRQHSKPPAVFYYPSATLTPPQADRRCAAGLLHYGNVGDRFTHTELPTA